MGGRERDEVRATACGLVVNVVVAIALLGWLGINGVAIGTSLGFVVVAGWRLLACWLRWRIAIWDLLGFREFLAATLYLVVAFLGGLLGLPWLADRHWRHGRVRAGLLPLVGDARVGTVACGRR